MNLVCVLYIDVPDHDQVQGARLCVYQFPMVTTLDLKDHQLWLGRQDTPLGLNLSNFNVLLFSSPLTSHGHINASMASICP